MRRRLNPLSLIALAVMLILKGVPAGAADIVFSREVGLPLLAAREALNNKRYDAALAEVDKARAVPSITAPEKWAAEQMRAAIYKAQGRFDQAAIAFEAAIGLVPLSPNDQAGALETLSQLWYRAGDYSKAAAFGEKALAAGGRSDAFRQMVGEAYYRNKEPVKAGKLLQALADEQRKAGKSPSPEVLQLLAASAFGSGDTQNYITTLRQQLTLSNSKDNWLRLFDAMARAKPIPERLDLDWARLRLAAGAYENPESFVEMAQSALVEELPAEAAQVLDQGWRAGILGKGPDLARHQRLRDYAAQKLADQKQGLDTQQQAALASKDANALARLGMARASLGQLDQGIDLMQQALKGKLLSPAVARLRLGMLQYRADQGKAAAQTLAALPANSDEARLGELWALLYRKAG